MKQSTHDAAVQNEAELWLEHGEYRHPLATGLQRTLPTQPSRHMLPDAPYCVSCAPFVRMTTMTDTHYVCPRCHAQVGF